MTKKSTKLIVLAVTALATFFSVNAKAQSSTALGKINFDIGVEAGIPTYKARTFLSDFEAGATARMQIGLSSNLAAMVTSGFYNFFDKNTTVNGVKTQLPGVGIIPVKLGLKGYLGHGVYFTGEAGEGYETSRDLSTNNKDRKVILAGGLGYAMSHADIALRYESLAGQNFNYGLISLRLAYGF
jgi:hypothetical protein